MDQGEEAGSASLKESPLDFALWKAHKHGEDTSWDSPWGPGRPGWHIECSAMAEAELGPAFAIHGGGSDLLFPHHENEIAQSEAAGRPFARIWMHNGMIETGAEKMSKSEGNIFQLSEALERYGREAVVDYLISGHYRQPLAFGPAQMEQAAARVERLRNFFREHPSGRPGELPAEPSAKVPAQASRGSRLEAFARRSPMTSTRRGRWRRSSSWLARRTGASSQEPPRRCSEMLELLGLGSLAEGEGPGRRGARRPSGLSGRARARRGRRRTSSAPMRSASGSPSSAGRSATRPRAPAWCRGLDGVTGLIYGRGRSKRPSGAGAACFGSGAPRRPRRGVGAALWLPRSPGRRRRGRSLPIRRPERAAPRRGRCWSPSTRSRTRATSGAVCRSAEFAGAAGVVIPERRSAEVTAATCKASAGAVEHLSIARVRNLADWLAEAKAAGFWIWGADAGCRQAPWDVDLRGPTVLVLGGEGKGIRPRVAAACDGLSLCPAGAGGLAQRLRGRRGAALRGGSPAPLRR